MTISFSILHSPFAICHLSLVNGHLSFVIGRPPFAIEFMPDSTNCRRRNLKEPLSMLIEFG